jgi:dGTPase
MNKMTWNNCFSSERFGVSKTSKSARHEFERDWDRLIFSSAFRRLQNKTQVFPLPEEVFVHNRLTHSLEVASVGRSLGKLVGKYVSETEGVENDDKARSFYRNHLKNVIANACLAHDMGNPAFGHSGEDAISKYFIDKKNNKKFRSQFSNKEWSDLSNFEGNYDFLQKLHREELKEVIDSHIQHLALLLNILVNQLRLKVKKDRFIERNMDSFKSTPMFLMISFKN